MKRTGVCPKCGGQNLLTVEPMQWNSFPVGFFRTAKIERWFCGDCGFTEEYVCEADMEKVKKNWSKTT